MTSSRKVKLQDRGTPEPKPSRKVVLDELLRSLQDLVTNELAVDVPLDDIPAPTATKTFSSARTATPAIEPKTTTAVREPEPEPSDLIVEELVAEPVAGPAEIAPTSVPDSKPAVVPASRTSLAAAVVKPATANPAGKSKPVELAIESGPVLPVLDRKTTAPAAVAEPEAAAPRPERKAAAPAPDPGTTARPRRGRLGDTVVMTPPRDIPPPPKTTPKRGGHQAVVGTPVPPEGLQQQLPYLDVSPHPVENAPDSGLLVEPDSDIPDLPASDRFSLETPAAKGDPHTDSDLLVEPEIEIPDLPSAGFMTTNPAAPSPLDRSGSMATDGPDELPDLDYSAVPTTLPAKPRALSVVDDDTGPSDIPLLEDAIDLDEHIELATPKPPAPAMPTAPRPTGGDPRRLAIQLAARLNVDLRREGKPVLGSDVIAKLARLLEESLAKGAPNMENTRPKKP